MRRKVAGPRWAVVVAVVAALVGAGLGVGEAGAHAGDPPVITRLAGGLGAGPARSVGQTPAGVALGPDLTDPESPVANGMVYVADQTFNVVRALRLATGVETVLAGTGAIGYAGDGGPATAAALRLRALDGSVEPGPGLAVDGAGDLYLADTFNHVIRKIEVSTGTITTVVGTGTAGFSGDGGPAAAAQLRSPSGLAVGPKGDLYIADTGNHRVRVMVAAFSAINTVAGTGTGGYDGDGATATTKQLREPTGVAFDSAGNLYVADKGNCRVRKVTPAPDLVISTAAGTGVCGYDGDGAAATAKRLNEPYGVAVDGSGNLYIADRANCLVRLVATGTGQVSTIAGKVPSPNSNCGFDGDGLAATSSRLNRPNRVVVSGAGLLIADTGGARLRRLATGTLSTEAGNGTPRYSGDGGRAVDAQLWNPSGLARAADGTLYLADTANHVVRKIDASGAISRVAGDGSQVAGFSGDGGPATAAKLSSPRAVALDAADNVYIADEGNCVVRMVAAADGKISTVAGVAPAPTPNCGTSSQSDLVAATLVKLDHPYGVAVAASGDLYIADTFSHVVRVVRSGIINRFAGTAGTSGSDGDGGAATSAKLFLPRSVAVAADGTVYIADSANSRVRRVVSGTISAFAGTGTTAYSGDGGPATAATLALPYAVSVGPDGILIADTFNDRIRLVAGGTIKTVAGSGGRGQGGDGGAAAAALLDRPMGVAAGPSGSFVVADTFNDRLRLVGPPPPERPGPPTDVTAVSGNGQVEVSWTAPADDGGARITGYTLETFAGGTSVKTGPTVGGDQRTAVVTDLVNGTAYTFTVVATNAVGSGGPSAPSAPATPRTVPGAPTGVTAAAGDGQAVVSWTAPAADGGAPVASYTVEARDGSTTATTATVGGSATSATVSGLTNGTAYTFVVVATNAAGAGPPSSPSPPVTPARATPAPPPPGPDPDPAPAPAAPASGYWMVGEPGTVFAFGAAEHAGNAPAVAGAVDIEATPSGDGYWVVDARGHVYAFGGARYLGGIADTLAAGESVTSLSSTASGDGYWLFTTRGRVVTFGDAQPYGDVSQLRLNGPVLDSVATPSGRGYYLVASDGGVFAFGDAAFRGSMGGTALNAPVRSLVGDPDGAGYWLVASDGGIFAFDAPFHGSMGGRPLNRPVVRLAAFGSDGYLMVGEDGGIFSFGSAPFHGSLGGNPPPYPIRSVTVFHRP